MRLTDYKKRIDAPMDQSVAEVDAYTAPESSEAVQQASLDALLGLMRQGAPAPLVLVRILVYKTCQSDSHSLFHRSLIHNADFSFISD